jgi:hypothetical protein
MVVLNLPHKVLHMFPVVFEKQVSKNNVLRKFALRARTQNNRVRARSRVRTYLTNDFGNNLVCAWKQVRSSVKVEI